MLWRKSEELANLDGLLKMPSCFKTTVERFIILRDSRVKAKFI